MLGPSRSERRFTRFGWLLFVGSAGAAALILKASWHYPLIGVAVLAAIFVAGVARWVRRRRHAALLRSGDVERVLQRWSGAAVPHPETLEPLVAATAFAAYGWVDRARTLLQHAARGPVWEAALEHRLFVDALLLTFEGDHGAAQAQARRLERLPVPASMPELALRIQVLRRAVGALSRAFAHDQLEGDRELLVAAGSASPLVHWAMRYGVAILDVDAGRLASARALLAGAPAWPAESYFQRFHGEIDAELRRLSDGSPIEAALVERAAHAVPAAASPAQREPTDPAASRPAVLDEEDGA